MSKGVLRLKVKDKKITGIREGPVSSTDVVNSIQQWLQSRVTEEFRWTVKSRRIVSLNVISYRFKFIH